MKDSFEFRKEWRDAVSGMSAEMRLEFYEAVIEYATTGNEPNLKPMARLAFNFVKATLDKDVEREVEIRKKRSDAGRMHKGNQYTNGTSVPKSEQTEQMSQVFQQMEQGGTNGTNGTKEKKNENEKEISPIPPIIEKEKEEEKEESFDFSEQKFADMRKLFDKRKAKFIESVEPYVAIYGKEMTDAFISYWTEPNKSHTKMRHELERTWDVSRRLSTWASRDRSHEAPMARAKRVVEEQARKAREERQSNTDELMRKRDQWTKQSVSLEEARNSEEYKRAMAEA